MCKVSDAVETREFLERFYHLWSSIACHCCHIVKHTELLELGMDCVCDFIDKVSLIETREIMDTIVQFEFRWQIMASKHKK
jgi:hypothetical protein